MWHWRILQECRWGLRSQRMCGCVPVLLFCSSSKGHTSAEIAGPVTQHYIPGQLNLELLKWFRFYKTFMSISLEVFYVLFPTTDLTEKSKRCQSWHMAYHWVQFEFIYMFIFLILKMFALVWYCTRTLKHKSLIFHKIALAFSSLQDKLEERETEPCLELVEEKLQLAESELQLAVQRAEQAEKRAMQLNSKGDAYSIRLIELWTWMNLMRNKVFNILDTWRQVFMQLLISVRVYTSS